MAAQKPCSVHLAWMAALLGVFSLAGPATAAVGADVPWVSYHAAFGTTNGQKLASRIPTAIENEAIRRTCVKLADIGHFVQWKVTKPANAIVIAGNDLEAQLQGELVRRNLNEKSPPGPRRGQQTTRCHPRLD